MICLTDVVFERRSHRFRLEVAELRLQRGQTAVVQGPSGCGKTTLLELIAGILQPQWGEVRFGEHLLSDISDRSRRQIRRQQIGLVFQDFELVEYLSVEDNILLNRHLDGRPTAADKHRAEELADRAGLSARRAQRPSTLSHGEQQRVAVCRALLPQPRLILADEPTANLDQVSQQTVTRMLTEFADESGATVLVATHQHDVAAACSTRLFIDSDLASSTSRLRST